MPRDYNGIEIDEGVVTYARANGVAVHYWTINDPAEMEELLGWCADGLITDMPSVMAELVADMDDPCIEPAQVTTTSNPLTSTTLAPAPTTPPPAAAELPRTGSGNARVTALALLLIAGGVAGLGLSSAQRARARRS